ncbi:MAG: aldehyde dehydrogenase family protein [Deinococcales bacterium]
MSDASKHWNAASIRSGPASSTEPPTEPLRPLQRIAGRAVPAVRGGTREIVEPARGAVLAVVPEGTAEDAAAAVAAARQAFDAGPWPRLHAQERARVLHRAAALIEEHSEELARLETWDTGKTLPESRDDMAQVAEAFHYFGSLVATRGGEVNPVQAEALSLTLHEPIGVAALITPWNYPLLQASWKLAPALAAGCTLVIKPSELTPLSTVRAVELLHQAGVPGDVANVVLGAGGAVGAALVADPDVDMVSFTGGIVTGRAIAKAAADTAKRVALELGGKNPNIVFEDADVDAALDHALNAVFYHAGQVCSAGSRLLVQEGLYERLVTGILERAAAIRLGFGWEDGTEMGPLVSEQHRAKVEGMIALALDEGATLRLGGGRPDGDRFRSGTFLQPTVLTEVRREMRIAHEEIFGPVLTVERFESEQDAIEAANGTRTGLAAAVWTRDVAKAVRVGRALRFGTVWLNDFHPYYPQAPWGGMKESGVGRELGLTGLREYQEEKHLYLNLDVRPVGWFGRSQGTTED